MKRRLDAALVHRGLARSRAQALELIASNLVLVNGIQVTKASTQVADEIIVQLKKENLDVSRGATKLRNALLQIPLEIKEKICLDVGASTGGFTQVLLENNAQKVFAVDVGYGQIDWSLRNHDKVTVIERFNARNLSPEVILEKIDVVVADLSFISLTKVLEALMTLAHENTEYLLMVKPQFELAKEQVPSGGVVIDSDLRFEAVWKVITFAQNLGLNCSAIAYSKLPGPSGNKEFFIRLNTWSTPIDPDQIRQTIRSA